MGRHLRARCIADRLCNIICREQALVRRVLRLSQPCSAIVSHSLGSFDSSVICCDGAATRFCMLRTVCVEVIPAVCVDVIRRDSCARMPVQHHAVDFGASNSSLASGSTFYAVEESYASCALVA